MPDFTNLDTGIIAQYWIYFIAALIIGFVVGITVAKIFYKREKDIFNQQQKAYFDKIENYDSLCKELESTKQELRQFREGAFNNIAYWNTKTKETKKNSANKVLHGIIHE